MIQIPERVNTGESMGQNIRQILMMRHGYAEAASRDGDDYFRALTREGVDLAQRAARGLRTLIPQLDAIYTSPLQRARETGVIMSAPFGFEAEQVKPASFLAETQLAFYFNAMQQAPGGTILYVGHLPAVQDFVVQSLAYYGQRTAFSPNSVAILSFREGIKPRQAVLLGFYTGEELALLADGKAE